MTGRLSDKVALVTGGARGQGEAEARLFAAEGAQVVICDVLEEAGAAVARALGDSALFVPLDVASQDAWESAVAQVVDRFGRVDALVNNAGVMSFAAIVETSLADYQHIVDVNQIGVFLGMRAVAPYMPAGSAIVNVSSVDGLIGMPGLVAYTASKFAVRGMTKVAALEFAARGIRVNSLHPGVVHTPMIDDPAVQAGLRAVLESVPLNRGATVDEIAKTAAFLICDDSAYCTGAEFVVDGGLTCGKHFAEEGVPA